MNLGKHIYRRWKEHLGGRGEESLVGGGFFSSILGGGRHSVQWLSCSSRQFLLHKACTSK